jgi:hypothetical protein
MLEKAADTFIAAVDLMEAEGRQLRRTGADLTFWSVVVLGSAVIAVVGVAAVAVGVAWVLAQTLGIAGALAISGAAAAILGIGMAALGRQRMRTAGEHTP